MKQDFSKYLVGQVLPSNFLDVPEIEKVHKEVSANDAILSAIYAVDPISKLPTGDISAYVSDKTSPDVKRYILENLMIDTSGYVVPAAPRELSDDDVMFLTRRSDESRETYLSRINKYGVDNKQIVERALASRSVEKPDTE